MRNLPLREPTQRAVRNFQCPLSIKEDPIELKAPTENSVHVGENSPPWAIFNLDWTHEKHMTITCIYPSNCVLANQIVIEENGCTKFRPDSDYFNQQSWSFNVYLFILIFFLGVPSRSCHIFKSFINLLNRYGSSIKNEIGLLASTYYISSLIGITNTSAIDCVNIHMNTNHISV